MSSILTEFGSSFLEKLAELSPNDKLAIGLAYINRQSELVSLFDKKYGTKMNEAFCREIQKGAKILEGEPNEPIDIDLLYSIIPDADDYSGIECSYVQNSFLSIYYLFKFFIKNDDHTLQQALDMALENIDVINYSKNSCYDEESVFLNEVKILNRILEEVKKHTTCISDILDKEAKILAT